MTSGGRRGSSGTGSGGAGGGTDGPTGGTSTVVISSPEELIASVPSMLGFPPGPGSVVVVCGGTADGGRGPVVRMDVDALLEDSVDWAVADRAGPDDAGPGQPGAEWAGFSGGAQGPAEGLARFCHREGVAEVHLVVIHPGLPDGYGTGHRAGDVAAVFEDRLAEVGTRVAGAFGVTEFAAGARWTDLFGMVSGVQVDPDTTQLAAVHTFDGRVRAASRDEITELYRGRDDDAVDCGTGGGPGTPGPAAVRDAVDIAAVVETHEDAARRVGVGEEVDDDELAELGTALLHVGVRDELYKRLAGQRLGHGDGRRVLWWAVARRRPGPERSVALLLLGAAAYFDGSGVHAWSALTAAVEADPHNSLARLLLRGLDLGLPPERLRRVAVSI